MEDKREWIIGRILKQGLIKNQDEACLLVNAILDEEITYESIKKRCENMKGNIGEAFIRALLSFLFCIMVAAPILPNMIKSVSLCPTTPNPATCEIFSLAFLAIFGSLCGIFLFEMMGIGGYLRYRAQQKMNKVEL